MFRKRKGSGPDVENSSDNQVDSSVKISSHNEEKHDSKKFGFIKKHAKKIPILIVVVVLAAILASTVFRADVINYGRSVHIGSTGYDVAPYVGYRSTPTSTDTETKVILFFGAKGNVGTIADNFYMDLYIPEWSTINGHFGTISAGQWGQMWTDWRSWKRTWKTRTITVSTSNLRRTYRQYTDWGGSASVNITVPAREEHTITFDGNGGNIQGNKVVRRFHNDKLNYSNGFNDIRNDARQMSLWHSGYNYGSAQTITAKINSNGEQLAVHNNAKIVCCGATNDSSLYLSNGKAVYEVYANGKANALISNTPITAGEDVWITGTYDGIQQKIYINGKLDNSANLTGDIKVAPEEILVGGRPISSGGLNMTLNAKVYKAAVYPIALSQEDITKMTSTNDLKNQALAQVDYTVNTPTKDGYAFVGWNTAKDGSGTTVTDDTAVTGDMTLYAQYEQVTFDITYDPNGASGTAVTNTYQSDDEFEIPGNIFNNGKALIGWNTKADGTGKYFEPEDAVHDPKDENGNIVTKLYAQWLPDAVTINYNANGGEFLPDEKTMNSVVYKWDGQDTTHPTLVSQSSYKEPVRDGYVFSGWESEDGAEFEGGDSIKAFSTKSTVNVSAKWTPVDQNTTLKMKDGEVIFENEPLHDVKIKKVDATTGKTLPGAGVKLQKKTSSGYTDIATKSTDSDGKAEFTDLKKGVYKIVETTAPFGYEINPKGWSFIISGANSGAAYKYCIKDLSTGKEFNTNDASDIRISDQTSPDLKLTKRDFGTDEPLRGGEFTLMNSWGLAYPSVKADENGVINFGPVPTGTYTLKEKSAPSGYSPYAAGWTIKIEQSGSDKKVTVTLNKQSSDSAANKEGLDGDASTKVYNFKTGQTMEGINIYNEKKPLLRVIKRSRSGANKPLSGAEFTLTPEGGGAPIVTKADSKGIVNIDGLQKNVEYLMRETKAPAGAKMSAIRWTITYDGSKVNISSTGKASNIDVGTSETYGTSGVFAPTVTITDELLDSFALVKQDGDTGKAITGARFKFLTKAEYQEYLSAKSYNDQALMDSLGIDIELEQNSNGKIEVPRDLINTGEKDIEIYAVETEAPVGYNKCDDIKINISIDANDKSTKKAVFVNTGKALSLNVNQQAIIPDYLYGDIGIVKKDGATKAALGGAGFKLTGTSRGGQEISKSATSADGTGRLTFSGIPEGYNYTIKEDQAPAGYSEPDTTWHAVVITQSSSTFTRGDGQKVTLNKGTYVYDANWKLLSKDGADYVITNNAAASVSFRKVDQNTKEGLTGAEFTLTGTSGNAAGDTRTIVTTGGTASFTSLKTGTYTLKETKAPDGYKISHDLAKGYTITVKGTKNSDVTVSKNGTALTADGTDNWLGTADDPCKQYDVANAPSVEGESFSIYKTDLGTTPLPGTKFTLKKSGYTKTVTVDEKGKAEFTDIPYGTYQMTETPLSGYRTSKGQGYWTVTVAKRVKSGNNITGGVTIKAADGTVLSPYKKGQMDSGYGLFIGENFIGEQGSATITGVKGDLAAGKDGKYLKAKDVNLMLKNSAGTTLKTFTSFPGDLDSLSLTSESTYTITGNYTVSDTGKDVKHYVAVSFTYYTDDPAKDAPKDPEFHIRNHQGAGHVEFEKKIDKTSTYLPGAVMQIKDSTGKVVKEWTTTNASVSYTLDPGDYVLHEKNPPAGYDTAKDIPFSVYADDSMGSSTPGAVYTRNSDKVSVVQMYDTKGYTLPNVGGKGTTIFLLTALVCILAYTEREILKKRKALKER